MAKLRDRFDLVVCSFEFVERGETKMAVPLSRSAALYDDAKSCDLVVGAFVVRFGAKATRMVIFPLGFVCCGFCHYQHR